MSKINKKMRGIWLLKNCLVFLLLLAVYFVAYFKVLEAYRLPTLVGAGVILVFIAFFLIIWPFLYYKNYYYSYDENKIIIKKGLILKHEIIIPVRQIQDLHTYFGPFMQLFGLGGIIISTAGSNFMITGLTKNDAIAMTEELNNFLEKRLADEEI